ncbi:MAG: SpoIIIAH-like family protein [Clostridia bacterium]|nr:SpoIIIAH-like family protein [Clostridia bacterium]
MLREKIKKILEKIKRAAKKFGRRSVAIACSVLLIGCAIALNFVLFSGSPEPEEEAKLKPAIDLTGLSDEEAGEDVSEDYFAECLLDRTQSRDEAMEVLLDVTQNVESSEEAKATALADMNRIALDIEREGNIETMIKAKGFEKCLAVVNGETASVVVESDTLTPGETAQISEVVYEAAGILPANLPSIARKSSTKAGPTVRPSPC